MAANTRFAVALHVLGYLVYSRDESSTSDEIAESVNTNPVVIRRLLAVLRQAGLVSSQAGPGGGWKLERPAELISLAEIYRAVEDEPLFALPTRDPSDDCEVGAHVHAVFSRISGDVERALVDHLAESTIADVVAEIARRVGPCRLELADRERRLL